MSNRRVVVTGLGLVTPLGIGVERSWNRLCQGDSAIKSTKKLGPAFASLPSQIAAWIDEKEMQDKAAIVSYHIANSLTVLEKGFAFAAKVHQVWIDGC